MEAGYYDSFALRHGTSVREFKNVEVRHPVHKGEVLEDRWELAGTELKVEAVERGRTRIVEVDVIVGFDPANVLT